MCTVYCVHRQSLTKRNLYLQYVAMIFLCKDFGYRFFKQGTGVFASRLNRVLYASLPLSLCDYMKNNCLFYYRNLSALLTHFDLMAYAIVTGIQSSLQLWNQM